MRAREDIKVIGVTGGIGSGKSTVCRICALRGIPVYDCDSRAKVLMCSDPDLRRRISEAIGEDPYLADGTLDRACLSRHIFTSESKRAAINAAVHTAVRTDIAAWLSSLSFSSSSLSGEPCTAVFGGEAPEERGCPRVAIVESALMRTASLDARMDAIWLVTAPEEARITRVRTRSSLPASEIRARIAAQASEFESLSPQPAVIINDGESPLLPQISKLLKPYIC